MSGSMLDFVRKAFSEGGAQLEVLSNLLDCPAESLPADMTADDRLCLALSEVLKLRTQVQALQQQVSHILQERERMHLLIWSELSRLANKLDGDNPPLRLSALLEEGHVKSDPLLRAILGGGTSTCPTSSCADTPRESASPADPGPRSAKRHRSTMEAEALDPDTLASSNEEGPRTENRFFINQWIAKQRAGYRLNKGTGPIWALNSEPWHCYVCGQEAKEAPGDHFCVGKYEGGHREGLKVYCQYCSKGTARMPDLRVHFRKIVYCRLLRGELKRMITDWANEEEAEESATTPTKEDQQNAEEDVTEPVEEEDSLSPMEPLSPRHDTQMVS